MNVMTIKKAFKDAGFEFEELTRVSGKAIREFLVDVEAYLAEDMLLLMFVDTPGPKIRSFMYYVGEERNQDVVGVGRDIAAFRISESRASWLLERVGGKSKRREKIAPAISKKYDHEPVDSHDGPCCAEESCGDPWCDACGGVHETEES